MKNHKFLARLNFGFIIALALGFALFSGCNKESSVSPMSQNQSDYNTSLGMFAENSSSDNTMALTEVKFLLRKIDLESEDGADEEEMNLGPLVVDLKVDEFAKVWDFSFAKLLPGNYREIHFQLHKPSPNENISDPEFIENTEHRYSVIIKGLYNGASFVYKTDATVSKEVEFEGNHVAVPIIGSVNITIRICPYNWFMNNSILLDPMNPASKHLIDQNIRNSFRRAFKDNNDDGEPD